MCAIVIGAPASASPSRALHGKVNVSKAGDGEGRVTSSPGGIDCGSQCSFSFFANIQPEYQPVTLTAVADPGSAFAGFDGACSGDSCTIDPIEELQTYDVTATFVRARPSQFPLAVSVTGQGKITSSPGGIDCPPTCSRSFATDSTVTLDAKPIPGWSFGGWGGACSGTGTCSVSMGAPRSVTATFAPPDIAYALAVATAGGSVTSDIPGISCGEQCVDSYGAGVSVTLIPASSPVAWGGACSGSDVCVVPMNGARAVTASIGGAPLTRVPVAVGMTGKGSITSTPGGIACAPTCGALFPAGGAITLRAVAAPGQVFAGWSGSCRGVDPTCRLGATGASAVTAAFVEAGTRFPVAVSRVGQGSVRSRPAGIACGSACSTSFPAGSTATLDALPKKDWTFVRWTGACTGKRTICTLEMDGPKSASATFGRVADPIAPRVKALPSTGARGATARLRYSVAEASGRSAEVARILRGSRLVSTIRGPMHDVSPDVLFYILRWRVPRGFAPGDLRFCVTSIDPTRNRSKPSCGRLRIT